MTINHRAALLLEAPPQPSPTPPPPPRPSPVWPDATWLPSPNYWPGRGYGPPFAAVLHTMGGTLDGTDSWFHSAVSQVSATFGIGLDGRAHQYVSLNDSPWANGILEAGNRWPGPAGESPNMLTFSCETEDRYDTDPVGTIRAVTQEQFNAVLAALRWGCAYFPSVSMLMPHTVISPITRAYCPGTRWMATGLFDELARQLGLQPYKMPGQ